VLAKVEAIFRPTSPDLPMPIRTTLLYMKENIDDQEELIIDPLCEVEDRLPLQSLYPFGFLSTLTGFNLPPTDVKHRFTFVYSLQFELFTFPFVAPSLDLNPPHI